MYFIIRVRASINVGDDNITRTQILHFRIFQVQLRHTDGAITLDGRVNVFRTVNHHLVLVANLYHLLTGGHRIGQFVRGFVGEGPGNGGGTYTEFMSQRCEVDISY